MAADLGDYAYFVLVSDFLRDRISRFQSHTVERAAHWAGTMALVLVTLWIMVQGYRIATGQSRDSMMVFVTHASRTAFVVMAATAMGLAGGSLQRFVSTDLGAEINYLMTGDRASAAHHIDKTLALTQLAMGAIDAVHTVPGDGEMADAKVRASMMASFGVAGPPMVAGAMLLLYQFTIALFVGLGPLFILCLMFDQTKELFRKWLMYGIGTFFSLAMLNVVTTICLELTIGVAGALWSANFINNLVGLGAEGLSNQAMQQGGIGLLMTVLIVSVPPMAAAFFSGTVGHFMASTSFGRDSSMGMQGNHGLAGTSPGVGYRDPGAMLPGGAVSNGGTLAPGLMDGGSGRSVTERVPDEIKTARGHGGEW